MENEFSSEFWAQDKHLESARKIHFKRLERITYLDHAGAALYSECQLASVFEDLSTTVFGNPHSRNNSSMRSTEVIEEVRNRVLHHFNVSSEEYDIIFTSNCTAALKLLAESFCFVENDVKMGSESAVDLKSTKPMFVYLNDNHTSVIGVREIMKSRNVSFECVTEHDVESFKSFQSVQEKEVTRKNHLPNNLFAYPAQSNFSGQRYPLSWIRTIQGHSGFAGRHGNWCILLDAASYLTTSTIDLKLFHPDFFVFSFYKIFGYPTGLGALLVKTSSACFLKKNYFGGGTVEVSLTSEDFHVKRKDLSQRFEDGTLPFLEILAVKHGFDSLLQVAGSIPEASAHAYGLARYVFNQLDSWHYHNGSPFAFLYHNVKFTSCVTQGPVVNFNLLNSDGSFIGFAVVEKLAQLHNIHFRTGCFCNMGACEQHLAMTTTQVKSNFKAGHVCGDDVDLVDGRPTGSIRISFGSCSTFADAQEFLRFVRKSFFEPDISELSHSMSNQIHPRGSGDDAADFYRSSPEVIKSSGSVNDEDRRLIGIRIYPVKSCRGFDVTEGEIGPRGLAYDRQWMVTIGGGACITQKREPKLCSITPSIDTESNRLILSSPGFCDVSICLQDSSSNVTSAQLCRGKVCGDRVDGSDCGDEAAEWFNSVLGKQNLRLVQQTIGDGRTMTRKRTVSEEPGKLSLANEGQYLLIGTASLRLLQSHLQMNFEKGNNQDEEICTSEEELIERFRPNLIVKTVDPFEEDRWTSVKIGSHTFVNEGLCNRCQMICIDQKTGRRTKEPLVSLFSLPGKKSTFGILLRRVENLNDTLHLSVGDAVLPA